MSKVSKGHLIDEYCTIEGELVESDGMIYSCTLNQTDIDANKNKFYIMQLVRNGSNYTLYTRWGRTGEKGRPTHDKYTTASEGMTAFQKQFKTKTGNIWGNKNFVKKANKYFLSDVSYDDELKNIPIVPTAIPDSKLHEKVQNLIKMLSDVNMMQNALVSLEIDTKKMPLGKIKQSQLDKANEILGKIQPLLGDINGKKGNVDEMKAQLVSLSSEYYTFLPMAFGRKKPPVINTDDMIQKYHDIVDELRNMVITVQMTENVKSGENPIDSIYNDVNTAINPLDRNDKMWNEIEKFVTNTQGPTHGCKLEVLEIFEVEQAGKKQSYQDYCKNIGNKTLLYHGTPQNCVLSIFKKDFYLDPSKLKDIKVQIAGKMFGYGVYFADSSKSFGYTRAHQTNNIGCYIVAEVALGNQLSKMDADYYINKSSLARTGHQSTKGEGRWQPSDFVTIDGIKIPNQPLIEKHKNATLRYNEHIVYDINQILIKYLIVLKNNGTYAGF